MEHEDDHLSTKVVEPNDDNAAELAPLHQVGCKFNEEDVEIHQNSYLCPTRITIGVMTFLGAVFCYVTRSNFSLNLLAMVQPSVGNTSLEPTPDYGPRFAWSAYEQSLLLGAFFYGYAASSIPIGFFVDKYGVAKSSVFYLFFCTAMLEFCSPAAAHSSFRLSFIFRLAMGLLQGGFFPAIHKLFSKWVPANEMGRFMTTCIGTNAGSVITLMCTGFLIESWGWKYSFYVPGVLVGVFALVWYFLVFEIPARHPRITATERVYIESNRSSAGGVVKKNSWPPLKHIVMSPPVWALLFLQFGSDWGHYFILTGVPKYLNEILGFQLSSTGILVSLPYIARLTTAMFSGVIVDRVRSKSKLSVSALRKIVCLFSHVLPGIFILIIPYLGGNPFWCVVCMTISFGFNGAVAQSTICNYQDLAPNYAASLTAIVNGISSCAGFLSPIVVAYFTQNENTIDGWHNVFVVGSIVYIVPAVVFLVIGSGEVQKWNTNPKVIGD